MDLKIAAIVLSRATPRYCLETWSMVGTVRLPAGSSGTSFGCGEVQKTGTSKHELKMHGAVRVEQTIEQLHPGTAYQLSGWLKAAADQSAVVLGVRGHGGPEQTVTCQDQGWQRKTLDFTTGKDVTAVIVFIEQTAADGQAYADNLGLPRSPAAEP